MAVHPSLISKWKLLFALLIIININTGCWDSQKIEDLTFSIGAGFDLVTEENGDQSAASPPYKLKVTYQNLIPTQTRGSSSAGASTPSESYHNITAIGDSIHELTRRVSLLTKPVSGEHVKVIVIGRKLAERIEMETLLNLFFRDEEFRESCLIFIAREDAARTLSSSKIDIPSYLIKSISDNQYRSTKILPTFTLQKAISKLQSNSSFILQTIDVQEGNIVFSGGGIIDGNTHLLTNFFSPKHAQGLAWITGHKQGGLLTIRNKNNQTQFIYEISRIKSKMNAIVQGDKISFHIHIQSTGRISEDWRNLKVDPKHAIQLVRQSEGQIISEAKTYIQDTINEMQKTKADVADFSTTLRIQHPHVWNKVKRDWNRVFSTIPITYDIAIQIEDYGLENMGLSQD
ncbi:Ger(x)C family spore germination protein [Paenibacillus sp. ACRRX]|uniref:Ger(x)C family spore germination protein n=1 Tax=unclassified Paenibacillus TaxID=185978 RepID=UPI001EF61519|nr:MULTISPECIES: Ger(x)C family spore germination protein [unclassified Paenibacillus]MCG7410043.1 Ger(x)C family spore germination protein [Paenibacillus sp. ACRRX]MDK8183993.1 Ger(x)C family spore germination protein [Paenibacillus sp. UMB4589-SE434]